MFEYPVSLSTTSRRDQALADTQLETAIADTTTWTGERSLDQFTEFVTKGMFIVVRVTSS
jgi:hypothetical protein